MSEAHVSEQILAVSNGLNVIPTSITFVDFQHVRDLDAFIVCNYLRIGLHLPLTFLVLTTKRFNLQRIL